MNHRDLTAEPAFRKSNDVAVTTRPAQSNTRLRLNNKHSTTCPHSPGKVNREAFKENMCNGYSTTRDKQFHTCTSHAAQKSKAGAKRLLARPKRVDTVAVFGWVTGWMCGPVKKMRIRTGVPQHTRRHARGRPWQARRTCVRACVLHCWIDCSLGLFA